VLSVHLLEQPFGGAELIPLQMHLCQSELSQVVMHITLYGSGVELESPFIIALL